MDKLAGRIMELREQVNLHNELYYVKNSPIISDGEYDLLVNELEELEKEYLEKNGSFLEGSRPLENIGIGSSIEKSKFKKFRHSTPMLSLANCYNLEELYKFNDRIVNILGEDTQFVAEPKLDGFSISLIYEKGLLVRGLTRGDGAVGEDVTENVFMINSIPQRLGEAIDLEVRGEIVMPATSFERINRDRVSRGEDPFSSPRNAAAGTIRQLNPKVVKERNLECFVYHHVGSDMDHFKSLDRLGHLGLNVVEHHTLCGNIGEVKDFIEEFGEKRRRLGYETDGVVVKVNGEVERERLGFRSKSPRWAIAYKYPAAQATTKINRIEFSVGRTGVVTPVAILEPVFLSGALIGKATLHNMREIGLKDIREGDTVFVERGGDVIPKVVKPVVDRRDGSEVKVEAPTLCPSCGEALMDGEVRIKCTNLRCGARERRYLEFFVSKEVMDISNLGMETLNRLFDLKLIENVEDIYLLQASSLEGLEGFREKSINNLLNSIEESKKKSFERVFFALGIEHVGKHGASLVVEKFGSIEKIVEAELDDLTSIEGVGPKTAQSIHESCRSEALVARIAKLSEMGLNFKNEPATKGGPLEGKIFLVTGTLANYRREDIKRLVIGLGGKFADSISRNVDFLIYGEKPGSKLTKARKLKEDGVPINILGEEEFRKYMDDLKK